MRTLPLVLLLSALPLFAQEGDLSVAFENAETRLPAPTYYTYHVAVRWSGEQPARDVVLELNVPGAISEVRPGGFPMTCTNTNPVRCTMTSLTRRSQFGVASVSVRFTEGGTYHATAKVTTSTPEGPVENNTASHTLEVSGLPNLVGFLSFDTAALDPGREGTVRLAILNYGGTARNIVVRARLEGGGTILRAEPASWGAAPPRAACSVANGEVTCHIAEMGHQESELVLLFYRAPDRRDGGMLVATGTVESDREDFDPANNTFRAEVPLRRVFAVSSSEDGGSGTLRQAIDDSNAACESSPCSIVFEVAVVQPRAPLPQLHGRGVRVDGGESRVLLDGSLLAEGHGLHYAGTCGMEVRNLDIRNFPGHGIEAMQTGSAYSSCYPAERGLFVRKTVLSHNERGIVTKGVIDASLRENVIHDNRRAGIFIDGSYYSQIFNNVVVGNGASGIFVNTSSEPQFGGIPPGADIVENVVHGNGEWGIVRTRTSGLVQMQRNSTIRNGLYGFDVGLDLGTPNREDDSRGLPNKPVLFSATYDPSTNTTLIRGTTGSSGVMVDFYASTSLSRYGYPEAESWLGMSTLRGAFEVRVPFDLRGQWITATASRGQTLYFLREGPNVARPSSGIDTSELSDAVPVQ